MNQLLPLYTHFSGVLKHTSNICCLWVNMEKISWMYRVTRGRRRTLQNVTLLLVNSLCLFLIQKTIVLESCDKITSQKKVHDAQPLKMMTPSCDRNMSMNEMEGFFTFPSYIQDFLYYRHCRKFPELQTLPHKCDIPKGSGEPFFLLAIKSSPENYERRAVLRKTWAAGRLHQGMLIRTIFLIGTRGTGFKKKRYNKLLELENKKHADILQWDFNDNFYNLTLKQVLFLDWMQNWCPTVDFIFSGDDDVFANTDNMVDFLKAQGDNAGSKHLFVGHVLYESSPVRDVTSKYFVPEQIEKGDLYSAYCSGGGYLLSRFTAMTIFQMSHFITIMPIDDAYIGVCLKRAGLHPMDHRGFWADGLVIPSNQLDTLDPCHYREILLGHKFLPDQIFLLWNEIHRRDLKCGLTLDYD